MKNANRAKLYSGQVNGKLKVEWRAGEGLYAQREETRGACCENWLNLSDSQTWSSCKKNKLVEN